MDVYLNGQRLRVGPTQSIGKGGEADVYQTPAGQALKVFKGPDHPDLRGLPSEQATAHARLDVHQEKLPRLLVLAPALPARVVAPLELAHDRGGKRIVGYTMPCLHGAEVLLRYGERGFRATGIDAETVRCVFLDLHATVARTHQAGVVIGDFNDLNVLVRGTEAHVIDADSFQFASFPSPVFTVRFVDPLLCDSNQPQPIPCRPHNGDSDWYAFAVMLLHCLLFVGPYGGIYHPKEPSRRVPHDARPLRRITIFHPEVRYPKPAIPFARLPDELLQHFHLVFEKDHRGAFPRVLLDNLRWSTCTTCGVEHARGTCPECARMTPGPVAEVAQVRGKVTARRVFHTPGTILAAALCADRLQLLYHTGELLLREDGAVVWQGNLSPHLRARLLGPVTLLGQNDAFALLKPGQTPEWRTVDRQGLTPCFDTNERYCWWAHGGRLLRDGPLGPVVIGNVLAGQTRFWIGPTFGFGFYRAGHLSVAFVFGAEQRGINDTVKLPPLRGQVVDAACYLSSERGWFLVATEQAGRTIYQCVVMRADGTIEATAQAEAGDGSWLTTLGGKAAVGGYLFAATDTGIVRIEVVQNQIQKTIEFPDTEPFVDADCRLLAGRDGLYVIGTNAIRHLRMS